MHLKLLILFLFASILLLTCTEGKIQDGKEKAKNEKDTDEKLSERKQCKGKTAAKSKYSKEANENFEKDDEMCDEFQKNKEKIMDKKDKKEIKDDKSTKKKGKSKDDDGDEEAEVESVSEKSKDVKKEEIDPKQAKQVIQLVTKLCDQMRDAYSKSLGGCIQIVGELETRMLNFMEEIFEEIDKLPIQKETDVARMKDSITNILTKAAKEFKVYEAEITEEDVRVTNELKSIPKYDFKIQKGTKDMVVYAKNVIQKLSDLGTSVTKLLDIAPTKLTAILSAKQDIFEEILKEYENESNIDMKDLKLFIRDGLEGFSESYVLVLTQANNSLSAGIRAMLSAVSTLTMALERT